MSTSEPPFSPRPAPAVPPHLEPFVVEQHYDQYTPVDHAVWRFVVRQNTRALRGRAVDAYHEHFHATGMNLEAIPDVRHMSACLEPLGWRAVAVDGFIPPSVFMDFQAYGLLPIAQDIRTLEHIGYTPAPDIIHEAAGHAPLLLDPTFGRFLRLIGEIGVKAIANREDYDVYEAIRQLSIVKEDPNATPERVREAEQGLDRALAGATEVSEAVQISRLHWWTVEYGLIGGLEQPRIYGAGLLSSMYEGNECLKPHVKRIPFSLECQRYAFDITNPQPQLFVVERFEQLFDALQAFAETMAFRVGGTSSLAKARRSGRVCTMVYSSGLQVSGELIDLCLDPRDEAVFFRTSAPSGLAVEDRELEGFGIDAHPHGLLCPVGGVRGWETGLENASSTTLEAAGWREGAALRLEFESGLSLQGRLEGTIRAGEKLAAVVLRDARARYQGEEILRERRCTVPIGESITSVFAGSADKTRFVVERQKLRYVNPRQPASPLERDLHRLYARVREAREAGLEGPALTAVLEEVKAGLEQRHPNDWLLRLELLELLTANALWPEGQEALREQLEALKPLSAQHADLITRGATLCLRSP